MDRLGESPWSRLWFYSNPVFVEVDQPVGAPKVIPTKAARQPASQD